MQTAKCRGTGSATWLCPSPRRRTALSGSRNRTLLNAARQGWGGGGKQALPQAGGGFQGLQLQEAQPGISDLECLLWAAFPLPQPPLHRLGASLQSSVFSPLLHSHSREPLIPCGVRSGSRFRPLQLTSSPWFVQVG